LLEKDWNYSNVWDVYNVKSGTLYVHYAEYRVLEAYRV